MQDLGVVGVEDVVVLAGVGVIGVVFAGVGIVFAGPGVVGVEDVIVLQDLE